MFHHAYTSAADALAPLVLAMIMLSVSVVLTMYLLAVGRRWVAGVLVGGAVALTVAVLAVHGSPRATALVDVGGPGSGPAGDRGRVRRRPQGPASGGRSQG